MTDSDKTKAIIESGYAGVDKTGKIVDRREYPDAVPIQRNTLLDVPEPKEGDYQTSVANDMAIMQAINEMVFMEKMEQIMPLVARKLIAMGVDFSKATMLPDMVGQPPRSEEKES